MAAPIFFTRSSLKHKTFTYDFAVSGGGIGIINTGVFLPQSFMPLSISINLIIDPASGFAATLDIGTTGVATSIVDNAAQGVTGTFLDYTSGAWGFGYTAVDTIPLFTFPTGRQQGVPGLGGEIILTIGAFVLTAGKFVGTVHYLEVN